MDGSLKFNNVDVIYRRGVSPAPATAFLRRRPDEPSLIPVHRGARRVQAYGVGAQSANFCQDAPLTRGQMAVFLSRRSACSGRSDSASQLPQLLRSRAARDDDGAVLQRDREAAVVVRPHVLDRVEVDDVRAVHLAEARRVEARRELREGHVQQERRPRPRGPRRSRPAPGCGGSPPPRWARCGRRGERRARRAARSRASCGRGRPPATGACRAAARAPARAAAARRSRPKGLTR